MRPRRGPPDAPRRADDDGPPGGVDVDGPVDADGARGGRDIAPDGPALGDVYRPGCRRDVVSYGPTDDDRPGDALDTVVCLVGSDDHGFAGPLERLGAGDASDASQNHHGGERDPEAAQGNGEHDRQLLWPPVS
ncbi:hypothetical protein [Haloarcula rara]|uniref:hypothetical protein n=1 Tax=Haloarcula rara TaxID=3033387 RepID=UPI0023E7AC9B|nr:hypothetical protein [Halomicroarcula sp. SHR3]